MGYGALHGPEDWPARARQDATLGPSAAPRPPGALPRGFARDESTSSRQLPVLVDLSVLFPLPDGQPAPADAALISGQWHPAAADEPGDIGAGVARRGRLVCSGEVRGVLHRWERRADGPWIAIVSYVVPLAGDPRPGLRVRSAPVPAHVVRPAESGGDTAGAQHIAGTLST